jgi:hypothetical protein
MISCYSKSRSRLCRILCFKVFRYSRKTVSRTQAGYAPSNGRCMVRIGEVTILETTYTSRSSSVLTRNLQTGFIKESSGLSNSALISLLRRPLPGSSKSCGGKDTLDFENRFPSRFLSRWPTIEPTPDRPVSDRSYSQSQFRKSPTRGFF